MKSNLVIYEGAMCCSTGLCGPEPDKALIELNETLKRIQAEYPTLKIQRFNLSFNIEAFLKNSKIFQVVKENGPGILPITVIDEEIVGKQRYLPYDEVREKIESA